MSEQGFVGNLVYKMGEKVFMFGMDKQKQAAQLMAWLEQNPAMMEHLEALRALSVDESACGVDSMELAVMEKIKAIGREGMQIWAQGQEALAFQEARPQAGVRFAGKKN